MSSIEKMMFADIAGVDSDLDAVLDIISSCGCFHMEKAAKNGDNEEQKNEINDLLYHVMVLAVNQGLEWSDVEKVLDERNEKIGNLKQFHTTDKNS